LAGVEQICWRSWEQSSSAEGEAAWANSLIVNRKRLPACTTFVWDVQVIDVGNCCCGGATRVLWRSEPRFAFSRLTRGIRGECIRVERISSVTHRLPLSIPSIRRYEHRFGSVRRAHRLRLAGRPRVELIYRRCNMKNAIATAFALAFSGWKKG
jgi:hypothetical protein